jgi:two-component system chemotaxis response regulator CheY
MKILIVEDDVDSQLLMKGFLKGLGVTHLAADGQEGVDAVRLGLKNNEPYDLICMDIMMPGLDGQQTLRTIREMEEDKGILSSDGVKIVMISALSDMKNKISAFSGLCDAYLTKPISKENLLNELRRLELIA